MTQYGVESKKKLLSSLRTSKEQDNLELQKAVTMLREDDLDEARRPQRLKAS